MAESVRDTIVNLFEAARQTQGAPYEADRFMAFLTTPPVPKGRRVADTFAGRRRYVRFIESVQLSCGLVFNNEEWERGYSLDDFVALVTQKAAKPGPSLRLAEQRLKEANARRVNDPVKFALLASPLLVFVFALSNPIARVVFAGLWATIASGVTVFSIRENRYAAQLVARIKAREPET